MKRITALILAGMVVFGKTFPVFSATDLISYIYAKAMIGDVQGLKNLAQEGYSLESKDNDGNTAYCLAIYRRNQTAIKALEMAGANIRPRCIRKLPIVTEPTIYAAAHDKDIEQLKVWQEYGVPIDLMNRQDGNTALCQAVYEKDCDAIDILLKAGASEYHACMRRVPQKVRQELDCRPVIIDWERIGLTALGVGLVGGGVAVALSGGGSSGESCAVNQHWDGQKCVTCPGYQCWDGKSCREPYKGEYTNPVTNRCMDIAPSPYAEGTYNKSDFETDEYKKGGFLSAIKASSAYARGYTGYVVSRVTDNNFGQLTYDQSSTQGEAKETGSITGKRAVIGVLSTGTEIANTMKKDSTTGASTTVVERYVNKDLAQEIMKESTSVDASGNTTTTLVGSGKWQGNLATNASGQLFGFNFDVGIDNALKQTGNAPDDNERSELDERLQSKDMYYASGTLKYFLGGNRNDTKKLLVMRDASKSDSYCGAEYCGLSSSYDLVPLEECAVGGAYICFGPSVTMGDYNYDDGYSFKPGNNGYTTDPAPHYSVGTGDDATRSKQQGTLLAGIIGAIKNEGEEGVPPDPQDPTQPGNMHGVAYNSIIIPAIADVFRPITDTSVNTLIGSGAQIILQDVATESGGDDSDDNITIAKYAQDKEMATVYGASATKAYQGTSGNTVANKGVIFIVGTGMSGENTTSAGVSTLGSKAYQKDATVSAGVPLTKDASTALKELFLSVTSVVPNEEADSYGGYTLASYAQPCGSTAGYCLSAPGGTGTAGGNLYSTVSTTNSDNQYNWGEEYGTSAAAAVVAGAAGVLKSAYPHLSSQEIVTILKRTATPLGACAGTSGNTDSCQDAYDESGKKIGSYSTFYGWGLVNLDAATKPVGALWVNNGFSDKINPYVGIWDIPSTGLRSSTSLSRSITSVLPDTFTAFDDYNRPFAVATGGLTSTHSTRKAFDDDFKAFMHGRDVTKVKTNDQFSMTYAPRTSDRASEMKTGLMEMKVDFGKTNLGFYYTEDTLNSRGNYFERTLNNPFVQIQEAYGAEAKHNLTSKLAVGMGFATGKNGFLGDGDKHYKAPNNRISMVETKAEYQMAKSVMFKASYGVMKEQDSVLGMMGSGAFKTMGSTTNFASAGVEIRPTNKFKLNLAYTYGWTTPEKSNGLMNLSRLTADGFAAVAQYDLGYDNLLGVSVSSPLRVRSGRVAFNLPVGRSATDDTIYHETFTGSMKPTARELDFALFYKDALTDALTIQSELGLRLHPDHQKDADPDYRAMFGLKWDY